MARHHKHVTPCLNDYPFLPLELDLREEGDAPNGWGVRSRRPRFLACGPQRHPSGLSQTLASHGQQPDWLRVRCSNNGIRLERFAQLPLDL